MKMNILQKIKNFFEPKIPKETRIEIIILKE